MAPYAKYSIVSPQQGRVEWMRVNQYVCLDWPRPIVERYRHGPVELLPTELQDSEKRATLEAVAQSSLGMLDPRSEEFVHALDGEPPTASLELMRGKEALREKQVPKALEHLQRAAAMEPKNADALLWMARAKHVTSGDT